MTITRTRRFARSGATYVLLAAGAVLLAGGVVGGLVERAAITRLTSNGAYEPLKTLPVKAYSSYLFSTVPPTTVDQNLVEIFLAVAVGGAVLLVAAAAWRTIRRSTTAVRRSSGADLSA